MKTIGLGILLGAIFGVVAELLYAQGITDYALLGRIAAISAGKGAVIAWLVPRSVQWLPLAIFFGMLLGTFFWATVPSHGSYPDHLFEPWNILPGAILGLILILREWRKPARVATRERNQQQTS